MNLSANANRRLRLIEILMFLTVIILAPQVMAATITVNSNADTAGDTGICTLRDAITSANNDSATGGCAAGSGDDTITFAAGLSGQTITLGSALPALASNISIDGSALASHVKISGNNAYRVFYITSENTVVLNHLDIINGKSSSGSGIFNGISILTVRSCTFSGNSADGGGIYNLYGMVTVSSSTFSGNSARNYGGGIMNDRGSLTVSNSIFSDNSASGIDSGGISGGGICNMDGTLTVSSSTFSGNSGSFGGSIVNDGDGSLTVSNSTFSGNSASKYGGGIFNGNMLTVSNSTFSGNSAIEYYGGGIYSGVGSTLTVSSSTFAGNSSVRGGGICNYKSTLTLINSILTDSTGGGDCVNNGGSPVIAMNNNLIKDTGTNACGLTNGTDGNIIGAAPLLGALADNGGSTKTMALLAGSPAINAGDAATCPPTDQRGYSRVGYCDIGAYEYVPPVIPPVTAGIKLNSIANITGTTVSATGTAIGTGITERGFFWWIPPSPETHWGGSESGLIPEGGSGAGSFSLRLTELKPGNTYHVKAYITVGGQLITSDESIFTTATTGETGKTSPTVITKGCTFNADGTVSATGEITDIGSSVVNVYGFVYSKHPAPLNTDSALPMWDKAPVYQNMSLAGTIKNLTPGKWYLRAYAHNGNPDSDTAQTASLGYGEDCAFTVACTPETCLPGDVNGDGKVSLDDAMLVLKILARMPVGNVNIYADVNNDGKIGLEELGYILQKAAGLR
jgi:CSLREA domain-containing protein